MDSVFFCAVKPLHHSLLHTEAADDHAIPQFHFKGVVENCYGGDLQPMDRPTAFSLCKETGDFDHLASVDTAADVQALIAHVE